ncbi:MAG: UDP-N-acetylmuramate--L-alanine ligase [Candidatus Doudnabacteria bacterium]|nr:UDP-N-acetylmuramate--L-alanine ligase [Candidatus Doudnabacteria bacterium]
MNKLMNLSEIHNIYFVGIGGIAMSATAGIARDEGYTVLGSDAKTVYAPAKDVLDKYSIDYFTGYDAQNIINNPADLYVLSAGEDLNNPEVKYIVDNDLPYVSFSELLYELSKDKLRIVVAGTHGKSTTAGLLGSVLRELDDSSFVVGAVLQGSETNFHKGDGHYFVFEGDEYKATFDDPTPKFQYYRPDIVILNNIEFDHPDMFGSIEEILEEFKLLIHAMPADGLLIYNADDVNAAKLAFETNVASFGYSLKEMSEYTASDIFFGPEQTTFQVRDKKNEANEKLESYAISLPGKINVYNALACIATVRALGFSHELLSAPLSEYKGVKRRFELLGKRNGITVIDDYAHHPTAVRETLEAARSRYSEKRIWAIFEPHTFSRTSATLPELVKSFDAADHVLIAEIYPARENVKDATISGQDVVKAISKHHKDVRLVANKDAALEILKDEAINDDVIIVMAVGSFNKLAYEFIESI